MYSTAQARVCGLCSGYHSKCGLLGQPQAKERTKARADLKPLIPWTRSFATLDFFIKGLRPRLPHEAPGKTVTYGEGMVSASGSNVGSEDNATLEAPNVSVCTETMRQITDAAGKALKRNENVHKGYKTLSQPNSDGKRPAQV